MLYEQTFRLLNKFKKRGEEQAARGEQITPLVNYFTNEAKLGADQTVILNQTTESFIEKVAEIDSEAHFVIKKVRASIPKNRKRIDKTFFEPPALLRELQEKREKLAFLYRDYLRDSLPPEDFMEFEKLVRQSLKNAMTAMPIGSSRPVDARSKMTRPAGSTARQTESGCAGWIYGLAIVGYNDDVTPRYVDGFNLTAVDYFAAICYDPQIQGYLDETCTVNGEGTLGYQEDTGFADWISAEVYNRSISGYRPDRYFTSLGEHWVRHWYSGTRSYFGYTAVCIRTPPEFCELRTENGNMAVPCPTPIITPTPSPSPTPPTVQIQEVGFTGDETIRRYSSSLPNPPQYIDNPDGSTPTWVRNGSNNSANSVAYEKGTDPKVFGKLSITPVAATSINALVRVKRGGQEISAQNAAVSLSANTNTAALSSITIQASVLESITQANPAKAKKATYDFDWEISVDSGQTWKALGTTNHTIFWTYGDVVEPDNCDSDNGGPGPIDRNCLFVNDNGRKEWSGLYDVALEKALGDPQFDAETTTSNPNEIPDKIAKFLARKIDDGIVYNPGTSEPDGNHPLQAYNEANGVQCSVNANLLRGLLRSIGIGNAETVYVWGGKPNTTDKRETGGTTFGYRMYFTSLSSQPRDQFYYSFQATRPESNEGAVRLGKNPHFTFHAMVKVIRDPDSLPNNNLEAKYYDPSYAKRLEANPARYGDYPYINNDLKFKKAANLTNPDPKKHKWVSDDETKAFVVRDWSLRSCLPNQDMNGNPIVCAPAFTSIFRKTLNTWVATIPPTSIFDNQGAATFTVWRASDGVWYTHNPYVASFASRAFGVAGDLPTPGDYDGDGITDLAVFRPSNATMYIQESSEPSFYAIPWNSSTDLPVSGDFDGDKKSDVAYYREGQNSTWFITPSSTGASYSEMFGVVGDKPVSGDFDGDGKTDIAVFRPSNATWYWRRSTDGVMYMLTYGASEDIIVPGDYDADGVTDFVVYRPSNNYWYVLLPASNSYYSLPMGIPGDVPVPGDYDGDSKSDFALWNPSSGKWSAINSSDQTLTEAFWGVSSDKPAGAAFAY